VYKYIAPKNPTWDGIFTPLCNPTTCQLIVLESCSNSQKIQQVFKPSMKKNLFSCVFMSGIISGVGFWPFWLRLPTPGPNCKVEVFCSSFYSFEPLIGFLAFLVQKLWPKNNKLINYLIRDQLVVLFFLGHNFWTRNPRKSIKVSKDSSLVSNKNLSLVSNKKVEWNTSI